jgi:hypothetical protein
MNTNSTKWSLPMALTIIVLGAVLRLIPHEVYNFTPVGAIAIFSGAILGKKRYMWLLPVLVMILSDLALELSGKVGFHKEMPFVYGSFIAMFFISRFGLAVNRTWSRVIGTSLLGSLLFFLVTNFGAWVNSPAYTKDFAGLMTSYAAGIPFYRSGDWLSSFALNGFMGDLFFTSVFFAVYALAYHRTEKSNFLSKERIRA